MKKNLWKFLLVSPVVFATSLFINNTAIAETEIQEETLGQVTSVSQFSDVQPTDWAFQALQSLVERYGCIAGYPNGTFRGNRALTRYEFAAGLNACLDRVNELIATATSNTSNEDLETIKRLQSEFSPELATLRGRVDAVEAKTAQLEANQFSTTSKLEGEVVIAVTDAFEGNLTDNNTTLGTRARINFVTTFSGKDTLYTRIQANNVPDTEVPLAFAGDEDTNAYLDALWYSFPLTKSTNVIAIANAGAADDVVDTVNQFDGDGAEGALSKFGTRNPIYYQMDGSGLGITQAFGDSLSLSLSYLASSNNDPSPGNGIFNGPYGALAQLTFEPSKRFKVGLTYINAYNQGLGIGSDSASLSPFSNVAAVDSDPETLDVPYSSNSYGVEATLGLSDNLVLGGWVGYTNTRNLATAGNISSRGNADIWNWAVTLGLPDLGKKGNLAGVIFGMTPKVTDSTIAGLDKDQDTSYHIEGFYQYKVNDNISITPGVIWVTAPGNDSSNDDAVIGTLRTTFTF
ncbi:MAG: iron uptake porin [Richelia sp. SM2_1_7]|nr:iron uptake porin [Richelia sp. SM2_1_7]